MRIIATIEPDDLDHAKKLVGIPRVEVRHIAGVRAKFMVTRSEFLTTRSGQVTGEEYHL